jgi:hypothetical protein
MDLSISLKIAEPVDQTALGQFFRWASVLGGKVDVAAVAATPALKGNGAAEPESQPPSGAAVQPDPVEQYRQLGGAMPSEAAAGVREPAGAAAQPGTGRRGRRPRAALTPDVPEGQPAAPAGPALPAAMRPPANAASMGLPPAGSLPATGPTPPAMPRAQPMPADGNGVMMMDDFRAVCIDIERGKPGLPFNTFRRDTWRDGTPKGWSSITIDNVPPADRARCRNLGTGPIRPVIAPKLRYRSRRPTSTAPIGMDARSLRCRIGCGRNL